MFSEHESNHLGLPVGPALPTWGAPPLPRPEILEGFGCRLEPLDAPRHADALFAAFATDSEQRMWTYLSCGPFTTAEAMRQWIAGRQGSRDPLYYAIVDSLTGCAKGFGAYLRIDPEAGSIEVGWLAFSPALQRSRVASAAMYLMMKHAFALGYRRYEWKCNNLNAPSRRAAARFGFSFEGVFRQARVDRGRNRDTAWFSVIDGEWPALRQAFESWLAADNFDADGRQVCALSTLTRPLVKQWHPLDVESA